VLIAFNKPFGVMCKFSPEPGKPTLADFIQIPNVYPAGRLDTDSEGLLLLTDDGVLQTRISDPSHKLPKTYWAQVEGSPTEEALIALRSGAPATSSRTRRRTAHRRAENFGCAIHRFVIARDRSRTGHRGKARISSYDRACGFPMPHCARGHRTCERDGLPAPGARSTRLR
jgi:pseudouridine synthase